MRILLIMDPCIPVPPRYYGGIERVVADLADGFVARGHDVSLWAAPGSGTTAVGRPFGREGEWTRWSNLRNVVTLTTRFWSGPPFDVVHNFGRLAYLAGIFRSDVAKVQTYMRPVHARNMTLAWRMGARRLHFTAVSDAIRRTGAPGGGSWSVIYNCARAEAYAPRDEVDAGTAPLVFLGRLERCKGAHAAIDVASRLRRPLIIAGTISSIPAERDYYERELAPRIDGTLVRYIGPVDDAAKRALLADAAALLSPVEWEEPFPIIIPEALLSGTPVVAFRRGGMPEGIDHGRTGFLCDTVDDMVEAVGRLAAIDRRECRREGERRFSADTIVGDYLGLYAGLLS